MRTMRQKGRRATEGFTLLELLVVVSVLAALAGLTATIVDRYERDAQIKLAEVEMARIASAIYRFRADTGYFPGTGPFSRHAMSNPAVDELVHDGGWGKDGKEWLDDIWFSSANLAWLFHEPVWPPLPARLGDAGNESKALMPWDMDAARGWHGPYLDLAARTSLTVDRIDPHGGDRCRGLSPDEIDGLVRDNGFLNLITGITDPFERKSNRLPAGEFCEIRGDAEDGYLVAEHGGSAYLYETAYWYSDHPDCPTVEANCIVLRSLGKNGRDDQGIADDLVLILEKRG